MAGGIAAVNDYYGYYRTWPELRADFGGGAGELGTAVSVTASPVGPGVLSLGRPARSAQRLPPARPGVPAAPVRPAPVRPRAVPGGGTVPRHPGLAARLGNPAGDQPGRGPVAGPAPDRADGAGHAGHQRPRARFPGLRRRPRRPRRHLPHHGRPRRRERPLPGQRRPVRMGPGGLLLRRVLRGQPGPAAPHPVRGRRRPGGLFPGRRRPGRAWPCTTTSPWRRPTARSSWPRSSSPAAVRCPPSGSRPAPWTDPATRSRPRSWPRWTGSSRCRSIGSSTPPIPSRPGPGCCPPPWSGCGSSSHHPTCGCCSRCVPGPGYARGSSRGKAVRMVPRHGRCAFRPLLLKCGLLDGAADRTAAVPGGPAVSSSPAARRGCRGRRRVPSPGSVCAADQPLSALTTARNTAPPTAAPSSRSHAARRQVLT